MIGVFGYLTWRSARNRIARQIRQLRSPRYLAVLLLGLAYLWFVLMGQRPAAFPHVLTTSSRTGDGMPELRAAIARLKAERGA